MSRRNRDRRKWKCAKCGNPFDPDFARAGTAEQERRAAAEGRRTARVIHQCAGCGALHFEEPQSLRPLTPAEIMDLYFHAPNLMQSGERARAIGLATDTHVAVFSTD